MKNLSMSESINRNQVVPALGGLFGAASAWVYGATLGPLLLTTLGLGAISFGALKWVEALLETKSKIDAAIDEATSTLSKVNALVQKLDDTKQVENLAEIEQTIKALVAAIDPQIKNIVGNADQAVQQVNENIVPNVAEVTAKVNDEIVDEVVETMGRVKMIFGGPYSQPPHAQAPVQPQQPAGNLNRSPNPNRRHH